MRKLLVVLCLGAVGAGLGAWGAYGPGQRPAAFRTTSVRRGDLALRINATGTIEPEEVVDVGAQVVGVVKGFGQDPSDPARTIDNGSAVEEGTVLARLDDALFKVRVAQTRASLRHAEADLEMARSKKRQADRDWQRAQQLKATGALPQADYETAMTAVETAGSEVSRKQAAVALAAANLDEAEAQLGYATIRSPVKGVIIDRRVNVGQTVVANLAAPSLFLIARDLRRMKIWALVNETDIGGISKGQAVTFGVGALPGEVFSGTVSEVRLNASMTHNVVTYTVVIAIDNSHGKLLPYLTARVRFHAQERRGVLLVRNTALRWAPRTEQVVPDARAAFDEARRAEEAGDGEAAEPRRGSEGQGTLWVQEGGFVRPVAVRTGLSDGVMTELPGEELAEGSAVVVGQPPQEGGDAGTPFEPRFDKGKGWR